MKRCLNCLTVYSAADWACPASGNTPTIIAWFPALELAQSGAGFPPEAFAELADLEANNFWFRARNRLIAWGLRRHFPHMRRHLKIGCGTG